MDPALIEELQTMAAGYQVLDSEGTTSAGTGQADATRWLEGFDATSVVARRLSAAVRLT